jgi:dolichol kinase
MFAALRQYFVRPIYSIREKWWIFGAISALFLAFFIDNDVLKMVGALRVYPLDSFMLFMTDFGMLFCFIVLFLYLVVNKKFLDMLLAAIIGGSALEISYLAKVIFQTPRPYAAAVVATIPLTQASGYSMPSLHTAFCFSLWPFLPRIFPDKKLQLLGKIIIITIALSRLYLGVHYLSDIIAGGIIGYAVARFWIYLQEQHSFLDHFIFHVKDKLELRRQVAHVLTGAAIVLLIKLQLINVGVLFGILLLGGTLSILIRFYRIPFIDRALLFFERPEDLKTFPGKGSFFLVLGALLSLQFFSQDIAMAAISIMAVGDAITTVIGTYFGKIKNPLNPDKHLEGTAIAIVVSTLAAFFFVPFPAAFFGSLVGLIFESLTVKFISRVVDDNLIIPLVAGVTMMLVR